MTNFASHVNDFNVNSRILMSRELFESETCGDWWLGEAVDLMFVVFIWKVHIQICGFESGFGLEFKDIRWYYLQYLLTYREVMKSWLPDKLTLTASGMPFCLNYLSDRSDLTNRWFYLLVTK